MSIDDIQAKNFIEFDILKIMIHLAWVANSMVIFSASYLPNLYKERKSNMDFQTKKLMKSSLICPWILLKFLKRNVFKIQPK